MSARRRQPHRRHGLGDSGAHGWHDAGADNAVAEQCVCAVYVKGLVHGLSACPCACATSGCSITAVGAKCVASWLAGNPPLQVLWMGGQWHAVLMQLLEVKMTVLMLFGREP